MWLCGNPEDPTNFAASSKQIAAASSCTLAFESFSSISFLCFWCSSMFIASFLVPPEASYNLYRLPVEEKACLQKQELSLNTPLLISDRNESNHDTVGKDEEKKKEDEGYNSLCHTFFLHRDDPLLFFTLELYLCPKWYVLFHKFSLQ